MVVPLPQYGAGESVGGRRVRSSFFFKHLRDWVGEWGPPVPSVVVIGCGDRPTYLEASAGGEEGGDWINVREEGGGCGELTTCCGMMGGRRQLYFPWGLFNY